MRPTRWSKRSRPTGRLTLKTRRACSSGRSRTGRARAIFAGRQRTSRTWRRCTRRRLETRSGQSRPTLRPRNGLRVTTPKRKCPQGLAPYALSRCRGLRGVSADRCSKRLANKLFLKVADLAALEAEYYKAIENYEKVAKSSVNNGLMKWSVKDYFLKAGICHMASGVSRVLRYLSPLLGLVAHSSVYAGRGCYAARPLIVCGARPDFPGHPGASAPC